MANIHNIKQTVNEATAICLQQRTGGVTPQTVERERRAFSVAAPSVGRVLWQIYVIRPLNFRVLGVGKRHSKRTERIR